MVSISKTDDPWLIVKGASLKGTEANGKENLGFSTNLS